MEHLQFPQNWRNAANPINYTRHL